MTTPLLPLGTPHHDEARRLLLLGAGELGREVALEAIRLGLEVVAVDRYDRAPAMAVAHRHHVIDMLDSDQLRRLRGGALFPRRGRPSSP